MKTSHWKWMWISITFTTVVLIAVLYFTIDERTFDYIRQLNPVFLVLAFLLHVVSLSFWALRIQVMTKYLGYAVPFRYCFNLILANLFVGAITPAQAGGEPVRIHQLYRAGVPVGDSTAIVITERLFDAIVLGITGAVVIVLLGSLIASPTSTTMIALYISWILMVLAIVIFLYAIRSPATLKRIMKKLSGWFFRKWDVKRLETLLARIDHEVDNFHVSLTHFMKQGKAGFLGWPIVYTALFWFSEFFTASLILMGLGQPPHVIQSFVAQIIIAIIMMIPLTPGGSGIAELSAASLYGLFVPAAIVGVFVVLW
ncbi:MAG: flippase-like domain-containing protein, partial [Methanomicrobiales archaeon]|nr:flippase-like domain-containing protein [Methanomicrobiales archaeon]